MEQNKQSNEKFFTPYISKELFTELLLKVKEKTSFDKAGANSLAYIIDNYCLLKANGIKISDTKDGGFVYSDVIDEVYSLYKKGVKVVPTLGYVIDTKYINTYTYQSFARGFIVQQKAEGQELWERKKMPGYNTCTQEQKDYLLKRTHMLAQVPQEHFNKFLKDYKKITDQNIMVDPSKKENFFYDKQVGFSFIDLTSKTKNTVFDTLDLFKKRNHRYFILYSLLPCHNNIQENYFSKEEIQQIKSDNIEIFKKCVLAMTKLGITKEDIVCAFQRQDTEIASSNGAGVFGITNENIVSILDSIAFEKEY